MEPASSMAPRGSSAVDARGWVAVVCLMSEGVDFFLLCCRFDMIGCSAWI
jgi:hypothetical protein